MRDYVMGLLMWVPGTIVDIGLLIWVWQMPTWGPSWVVSFFLKWLVWGFASWLVMNLFSIVMGALLVIVGGNE